MAITEVVVGEPTKASWINSVVVQLQDPAVGHDHDGVNSTLIDYSVIPLVPTSLTYGGSFIAIGLEQGSSYVAWTNLRMRIVHRYIRVMWSVDGVQTPAGVKATWTEEGEAAVDIILPGDWFAYDSHLSAHLYAATEDMTDYLWQDGNLILWAKDRAVNETGSLVAVMGNEESTGFAE